MFKHFTFIFLIAFLRVEVIEGCPITPSKVFGRYFLAETIKSLINSDKFLQITNLIFMMIK